MKYVIDNPEDFIRIDKYLIDKTDNSRTKVQEMIKLGLILVNGKQAKNSLTLKENDIVEVTGALEVNTDILPEKMDLNIIYEDSDVIVVDKPSGLVVHPSVGHFSGTLVNGLLAHTNNLSHENGVTRPGIVHRIDKDTSGLLIVAKNNKAHLFLSEQLKDKTLSRKYIALVEGVINNDTGTIDAPIGRDPKDRKKMCVTDQNAKNAVTNFRVLKRYKTTTLLECFLETGRTHQIRVHMKYINHPIVNDPVYGKANKNNDFGQMLHAVEIEFVHPTTLERLKFTSNLPEKFKSILDQYKE